MLPLAPLRNAPPEPPAWIPSLADMEAYAHAHPHDVGAAAAAAVAEVDGPAAEQAAERRAAEARVGGLGCSVITLGGLGSIVECHEMFHGWEKLGA